MEIWEKEQEVARVAVYAELCSLQRHKGLDGRNIAKGTLQAVRAWIEEQSGDTGETEFEALVAELKATGD